jgi:hypothetical protein
LCSTIAVHDQALEQFDNLFARWGRQPDSLPLLCTMEQSRRSVSIGCALRSLVENWREAFAISGPGWIYPDGFT